MKELINNHWIFVITEYSNYNSGLKETLEELNREHKWKIGLRTQNKQQLKKNDKSIFYVSGNDRMYFAASAVLNSNFINERDPIYGYVRLRNLCFFDKPVFTKPILGNLDFIKNKKHWGLHFQRGIVKISKRDYDKIIYESST